MYLYTPDPEYITPNSLHVTCHLEPVAVCITTRALSIFTWAFWFLISDLTLFLTSPVLYQVYNYSEKNGLQRNKLLSLVPFSGRTHDS